MVALRHDSVSVLERLMDLPLRADKALSTEIKLPVHRTNAGAVAGGDSNSKSKETTLAAGERCVPLCCCTFVFTRVVFYLLLLVWRGLAINHLPASCGGLRGGLAQGLACL